MRVALLYTSQLADLHMARAKRKSAAGDDQPQAPQEKKAKANGQLAVGDEVPSIELERDDGEKVELQVGGRRWPSTRAQQLGSARPASLGDTAGCLLHCHATHRVAA